MNHYILISVTFCFLLVGCGLGPRSQESSSCSFCSRHRSSVWTLLGNTKSVKETRASKWIDKLYPEHKEHNWLPISASNQLVFPIGSVGCGGTGGLSSNILTIVHDARQRIGDKKAIEFLNEYHETVKKGEDAIREYAREISKPGHQLFKKNASESK